MSKQLGLMLVKEKIITRNQLEEASSKASGRGVTLIPTIINLGLIDDADLSIFISEQLKVPLADRSLMENIPDPIIKSIAKDLVDEFDLMPIGMEKNALKVAMVDPTDQACISELRFFLGKKITPMVASLANIHEAQSKYYHLKRPEKKLLKPSSPKPVSPPPKNEGQDASPTSVASSSFQSTAYSSVPPKKEIKSDPFEDITIGGSKPRSPIPASLKPSRPAQQPLPAMPAPKVSAGLKPSTAGQPDIGLLHRRTLSFLDQAKDKDQIADAFLHFAGKILKRVCLFTIKKNVLLGWMGYGENLDPKNVKGIMIPLNSPSIFQRVRDSKVYYFGEVPNNSVNQIFLTALGGIQPQNVILIPILIRDKAVCVFYGDSAPEEIDSEHLHYLHLLIPKVATSLESLIRKMKVIRNQPSNSPSKV